MLALERASLLALALSRSGTRAESKRRVRLVRELDATLAELAAEGYTEETVLAPLRAQAAASWASAPPELRAEAEAAAAAGDESPLSAADVRAMLGDALKRLDVDLAKWRLGIRD